MAITAQQDSSFLAQLALFSCANASVVDCLKAQDLPSDVDFRAALMRELGLTEEPGTVAGNAALRDALNARSAGAESAVAFETNENPRGVASWVGSSDLSVPQPLVASQTGVSEAQLDAKLNQLENKLTSLIYNWTGTQSGVVPTSNVSGSIASGGVWNAIAGVNKIDKLSGITITNATVSGVTGLTDADIPDSITLTNYLPLTGGTLTTTSSSQFSVFQKAYFGGTATSTFDSLGSLILAGKLTVSTTTATSTFAGGLQVSGLTDLATTTITGALTVVGNTTITGSGQLTVGDKVIAPGEIGVGTTTPYAKLAVQGTSAATTSFAIWGYSGQTAPLADVFNSSGSNLFRITSAGNIGIGTSTPWGKLSITGSGTGTGLAFAVADSANTPRFVIQDQGNVGIGTASPDLKFQVTGSAVDNIARFQNTSASGWSTLAFRDSSGADKTYVGYGNSSASVFAGVAYLSSGASTDVVIGPAGTERARFTSMGNVGIGTTNPGTKLHVEDLTGGTPDVLRLHGEYNSAGDGPSMQFRMINTGATSNWTTARLKGIEQAGFGGQLVFETNLGTGTEDDTTIERMRIDENGNIGIGTTTPATKLQVLGSASDPTTGATKDAVLRLTTSATNAMNFGCSASSPFGCWIQAQENSSGNTTYPLSLNPVGGNVGIGTTTPAAKLHITGNGDTFAGASKIELEDTGSNSGSRNWTIGSNSGAQWGALGFFVSSAKGATPTSADEKFTILSSGNVGIGTTSPWRTLSVSGTMAANGLTAGAGAGSLCLTSGKEVVYSDNAGCTGSSQRYKHDIADLDSASGLAEALELRPVSFVYNDDIGVKGTQVGFIAEDVAQVDERLITRDEGGIPNNVKYTNMVAVAIKAIQDVWAAVVELQGKVASLFESDTAQDAEIAALKAEIQEIKAQIGSQGASAASSGGSSGSDYASDTEAPVITIHGNNPAEINVGDTYNDLGASVSDNVDNDLGIRVFLGSTPMEFATLDTSEPNEWHIHYVATDNAGNTATSTRTVIVKDPNASEGEATLAEEPDEEPTQEPGSDTETETPTEG